MTSLNQIQDRYEALTTECTGLLYEIRKGDPDTKGLALGQFAAMNAERVKLMGLLNLIPVPR